MMLRRVVPYLRGPHIVPGTLLRVCLAKGTVGDEFFWRAPMMEQRDFVGALHASALERMARCARCRQVKWVVS